MRIRSLPRWRPPFSLVLGLVTVAAAAVAGLAAVAGATLHPTAPHVYSLASLQRDLARDPAEWLGRPVHVRAVAVQCQGWSRSLDSCFEWQPALIDADDPSADALPIVTAPARPHLAWLRGLAVIGGLLPRPRPIGWGVPPDFTVRLQARACLVGNPSMCYVALIQDVTL